VFALVAIVLLEGALAIALCLLRWTLFLAPGVGAARFCVETGAGGFAVVVTGLLATMLTRCLMHALANRFLGAGPR
jgi:hypothetical protein